MPYFKDQNGALHWLSEQDVSNGGKKLLPPGCVEITDEQAAPFLVISEEERARLARHKRDALLIIADRLINTLEDVGGTAVELRAWRVALRDWPATRGFPDIATIPDMPEGTVVPEDLKAQMDELLR